METQENTLNIKNLCSRKLLELMREGETCAGQRRAIERELRLRRHYLEELKALPAVRH